MKSDSNNTAGSDCQERLVRLLDSEYDAPEARHKTRRDRIKTHRAKRNRRRFYVIINGEERARNSQIRVGLSKPFLPNAERTREGQ